MEITSQKTVDGRLFLNKRTINVEQRGDKMTQTKISTYRQRGYKNTKTGDVIIVYSSDPMPTDPVYVLEWDNQVTETTMTSPTVVVPASGAV
jgi:hypothetical protein